MIELLLKPTAVVEFAKQRGVELAETTLATWRSAPSRCKARLPWRRIGGRVYYRQEDVERFLAGEQELKAAG